MHQKVDECALTRLQGSPSSLLQCRPTLRPIERDTRVCWPSLLPRHHHSPASTCRAQKAEDSIRPLQLNGIIYGHFRIIHFIISTMPHCLICSRSKSIVIRLGQTNDCSGQQCLKVVPFHWYHLAGSNLLQA